MSETSDPSEEGKQPKPASGLPGEPAKPTTTTVTPEEKQKKEFWNGFFICLGLNSLFGWVYIFYYGFGAFIAMETGSKYTNSSMVYVNTFWLAINLFVIILLVATRRKATEGVVAGVALGFAISLLAGVCMTVTCFGGF